MQQHWHSRSNIVAASAAAATAASSSSSRFSRGGRGATVGDSGQHVWTSIAIMDKEHQGSRAHHHRRRKMHSDWKIRKVRAELEEKPTRTTEPKQRRQRRRRKGDERQGSKGQGRWSGRQDGRTGRPAKLLDRVEWGSSRGE